MRIRYKPWARPELEASKFYIDNPQDYKGKWKTLYKNELPLHIELGCGKGSFIANIAVKNEKINYLAVDLVDAMLGLAKRNIENIYKENEEMAKSALRVLACGYKVLEKEPTDEEMKEIEKDLIYLGMCGMIDPPRPEAKIAVAKCKTAGIKTVMITGDHKITAIAIAKELGILESEEEALTGLELENMSDEELTKNIRRYSVYARVSPEHKVRIVKAWKANGEIVAMTGDRSK